MMSKLHTLLSLTFHWQEHNHMAIPTCKKGLDYAKPLKTSFC